MEQVTTIVEGKKCPDHHADYRPEITFHGMQTVAALPRGARREKGATYGTMKH